MTAKVFSKAYLDDLILQARASPRRRPHSDIHADFSETCQRTFNALEPDSYLRPHQHASEQGAETMIAIRGVMLAATGRT